MLKIIAQMALIMISTFRIAARQRFVSSVTCHNMHVSHSSKTRNGRTPISCPRCGVSVWDRPETTARRFLHAVSPKTGIFRQSFKRQTQLDRSDVFFKILQHDKVPVASFASSAMLSDRHLSITERAENIKETVRNYVFRDRQKGLFQKFEQPEVIDDTDSALKMRYVYLTTCVEQWEDVPVGVKFDVAYVDSHPETPYNLNTPIIVGLHGSPGSHHNLIPILEPMVAKGYRVIIPNFPGFGYTRGLAPGHEDCFTHTPEEKSSFIADFLTVIGIPRVDLLVAHSSGCYPLLDLCAEFKGVQSALLICPTLHTPYRALQPLRVLQFVSQYWEKPMFRPFLKAFVLFATRKRYKKTSASDKITTIRTMVNVDFDSIVSNMVQVTEKKLPCCVVFSTNDESLQVDLTKQFVSLMGISEDRITKVSMDEPDTSTGVSDYPKAVMLEGGTHYPIQKYKNVILSEQLKLLKATGKGR